MSSDKKNTALLWGGTAFAVIAIIGVAVIKGRGTHQEPAVPQPVAIVAELPAEQPAAEPVPESAATVEAVVSEVPKSLMVLEIPGVISADKKRLLLDYTCYRANKVPPLKWSDAPKGTKSFIVMLEQRKAGSPILNYWTAFGIPGTATSVTGAKTAVNDLGAARYAGPCDPKGKVNYAFRLLALDIVPDLPAGIKRDELMKAAAGHVLGETELAVIHYNRL